MSAVARHDIREMELSGQDDKGVSLVVIATAIMPFTLLFGNDRSFTFQSVVPSIVLMVVACLFSSKARRLSRQAVYVIFGFLTIMAVSNFLTASLQSYLITSNTVTRFLLFTIIILFYGISTSHSYSRRELSFLFKSIGASTIVTSFLEIRRYLQLGLYAGRVSPVTLLGQDLDPNYFALLVVVQIACAYVVALYSINIITKLLYFIFMCLGFVSVILTGSRSGMLCSIAVLGLGFIAYYLEAGSSKLSTTILLIVFFVVLLFMASRFMSDWMFDRFFNNDYNDSSNAQRLNYWQNAIQRWPQRPLFGFGVGNYNYFFALDRGMVGDLSTTTHGTVTDFLVDFGILGLGLLIYIVGSSVLSLAKRHVYIMLAVLPGIVVCTVIIGAERTVALWLWIILFRVVANYFNCHPNESLYDVFQKGKR